jgi:hypothetical protein
VRLATVKAFRRATYRPIEKTRSMKAAEVDISQCCPEFLQMRAMAHDGCSINYGIDIRSDTDEAIRKAVQILSVVIRRNDLKVIFSR